MKENETKRDGMKLVYVRESFHVHGDDSCGCGCGYGYAYAYAYRWDL